MALVNGGGYFTLYGDEQIGIKISETTGHILK